MARSRENIVYHNIRMNLDNEQHRRIHKVLADLNTNVHKSVNQFLIDATDYYIKKLEGTSLTNENICKQEESIYITKGDLEKMRREIKDELQRDMIIILGSALTTGKVIQMPGLSKEEIENNGTEEELGADETTIGLASSWG